MIRGRRRKVLLEKTQDQLTFDLFSRNIYLTSPPFFEPFKQNRFSLNLECGDGDFIESYKIRDFKIENFNDKNTITVTSILLIGDWIEKFKKMDTVKIFFFDPVGNISASLDYDTMYEGYSMGASYQSDEILMSTFKYQILE